MQLCCLPMRGSPTGACTSLAPHPTTSCLLHYTRLSSSYCPRSTHLPTTTLLPTAFSLICSSLPTRKSKPNGKYLPSKSRSLSRRSTREETVTQNYGPVDPSLARMWPMWEEGASRSCFPPTIGHDHAGDRFHTHAVFQTRSHPHSTATARSRASAHRGGTSMGQGRRWTTATRHKSPPSSPPTATRQTPNPRQGCWGSDTSEAPSEWTRWVENYEGGKEEMARTKVDTMCTLVPALAQ